MDGGVPPLMRTQLTYSTGIGYFDKTLAANTNASFLFRGNGLFDPDYQVGGQQPMGFDQWSTLYRHYRVLGSKIEVTLGQGALSVVALNSGGAETTGYVFDAQNSTSFARSKYSVGHTLGGTMAGNIVLKDYQRSDVITGFDKNEDNLSSQVNSDPGTVWYWIVTFCNGSATVATTYSFHVRITYYVEFFHPYLTSQS